MCLLRHGLDLPATTDCREGAELNQSDETDSGLSWSVIYSGVLMDAPGRFERWTEAVRYVGRGVWELLVTGTDWAGGHDTTLEREVLTAPQLVEWVTNADEEYQGADDGECVVGESGNGDEPLDVDEADDCGPDKPPDRQLGSRGLELLELAALVGDQECVSLLQRWRAREWPAPPPPPQVLAVVGVERRGVWIRVYHDVYRVETDQGPAFAYPPAGNRSRVVLCNKSSTDAGVVVVLPPEIVEAMKDLRSALEALSPKRASVDASTTVNAARASGLGDTSSHSGAEKSLAAMSLEAINDDYQYDDVDSDSDSDSENDSDGDSDHSQCPHCGSTDDCKHHLATFCMSNGEAVGGLLYTRIEEVSARIEQIARGTGKLTVGASEILGFRDLMDGVRAAIDEGADDADVTADLQSCQAKVIVELLRENSLVETSEYTVDESSGTWRYVTLYALDPDGVVAWLLAVLRDAASDAKP